MAKKSSPDQKNKILKHVENLIADINEDGNEAELKPTMVDLQDVTRLVDSTKASKFITPVVIVLVSLLFFSIWFTEVAGYWGMNVKPVPVNDKQTITALFGLVIGLRQVMRGEAKKKIIQSIQ
jgi:hypothetical protein